MPFSPAGFAKLKQCEGCELNAYRDGAGILTIGYGHTGAEITEGLAWSQAQADAALKSDVDRFGSGVDQLIENRDLSDNQFSALVMFAYNIGLGAFGRSTALREVNAGTLDNVPTAMMLFNKIRDSGTGEEVVSQGLVSRRNHEIDLWNTPMGPVPGTAAETTISLHQGDSGNLIGELQRLLSIAGYQCAADGNFGPGTEAAVKRFQAGNDLTPDGVVGPATWAELRKAEASAGRP